MSSAMRRLARLLESPRLAIGLIAYIGVLAVLGTVIPQGQGTEPVQTWAAQHPVIEKPVRLLGLHRVTGSALFLGGAVLLAASTAACSWRRTLVATRQYRWARRLADPSVRLRALEAGERIACGDSTVEALDKAECALREMGMRCSLRSDAGVVASEDVWTVYGSPAFHWALVALIVVVGAGRLTRSEGLMGVPVGSSLAHAPESYRVLETGPLYSWSDPPYVIASDRLELSYVVSGIERGPAPRIELRAPDGRVLARQFAYPNNPLRAGSLTIHANDYGLSATCALVGPDGGTIGEVPLIVDFDDEMPSQTTTSTFSLIDSSGRDVVSGAVSVILDAEAQRTRRVPASPKVRLKAVDASTQEPLAEGVLGVGDAIELLDGSALRLERVGYYVRLSVVDDWSVPVLYGLLVLAVVLASVAILGRPIVAVVAAVEDGDPGELAVWIRGFKTGDTRHLIIRDAVVRAVVARRGENTPCRPR